jgi:hypothetical protein
MSEKFSQERADRLLDELTTYGTKGRHAWAASANPARNPQVGHMGMVGKQLFIATASREAAVSKLAAGNGWNTLIQLRMMQTFAEDMAYLSPESQKLFSKIDLYFAGWPLKTTTAFAGRDVNQVHGLSVESFVGFVTMVDDAIAASFEPDQVTALRAVIPAHRPDAVHTRASAYSLTTHHMFQAASDYFIREYGGRAANLDNL